MPAAQNRLIELLPRTERGRLLAMCEPFELRIGSILAELGKPTRYIYFPTAGFISLVMSIDANPALELGMVGSEGMLGVQVVLGVEAAPLHALVQGQGTAWRIGAKAFRGELARSASLRHGVNRYVYVLMSQLSESAACMRYHEIGPRLARWLLMSRDRAHSDEFLVTHEFLAYMLGVRRVGITNAASALQSAGLIEYRRGKMTVLDPSGLEAAACNCYAADQRIYATLFDTKSKRPKSNVRQRTDAKVRLR